MAVKHVPTSEVHSGTKGGDVTGAPSQGEFSLISPGTKNPGHVSQSSHNS